MLNSQPADHLSLDNNSDEYIHATQDHKKNTIKLDNLIQNENKTNNGKANSQGHSPSSLNKNLNYALSNPISRIGTTTDDSIIFTNPSSSESQNTSTEHTNSATTATKNIETNDILNPLKGSSSTPTASGLTIKKKTTDETVLLKKKESEENLVLDISHKDEHEELFNALNNFAFKKGTKTEDQLSENGSYLQDESQDHVLLNTYVKKRSNSARTNITIATNIDPHTEAITTQDANDPILIQRNRNSNSSKNIDTATLEIERMRNSVLSKREKKKLQQKFLDDDKVLVGNKVSEGHVNYVIAYNMLTGIRVSVSRCNGIMKPLTDSDFSVTKKLVFDVTGNELTPSSKYDFKFKDYSPTVFRELRLLFGLDPADYLVSLTSKYILSELNSPGKSGSFFYFSRDYRFIIKTIHRSEHVKLRHILKDYHTHIKNNPNTMISQFYGLHRVKMPLYYGKGRKIYFIIMNNLFPPHRDIHKTFDLKGSTMGRYTNPKPNGEYCILKDINWIHEKQTIKFGPKLNKIFIDQLKRDVQLLIRLNMMDYSFLIGFHDLSNENHDETVRRKKLSVFSPISSNLEDLKNTNPKLLSGLNDLPNAEHTKRSSNIFYSDEGGVVSTGDNNTPLDEVYYFGIIDCLTNYSLKKKLETIWRTLGHERSTVSAVPPKEYGERFLKFLEDSINENTLEKNGFKEK